jgi:RNA polymerase sigma factor (sigma-70 family)
MSSDPMNSLINVMSKLEHDESIAIQYVVRSAKKGWHSVIKNAVLKAYENYINSENVEADKKDEVEKKYEDMFSLYLEAIDKHMMDNVYKKVKNDTATGFEREALSKYYMVIHLKDTEYLEYKYRKQIFLIQLDYDTVKELNKEKLTDRYEHFYASRMEALYKKLLKNYSIKLSDDLQPREKDEIYNKIFGTVEEYITDILPIKMKEEPDNKIYKEILSDILGTDYDSISRGLEDEVDKKLLKGAIAKLNSREKNIMELRFGFITGNEKTQKEVADMLGISQSYISRLEKKIISKMRKEILSKTG